MSMEKGELRKVNDGERVLIGRHILSHNAHVKIGKRRDALCKFCVGGVDEVITAIEVEEPTNDVVPGSGGDKEGDAPPASDSRKDREEGSKFTFR